MITYRISREALAQRPYHCKKKVSPEENPLNFEIIRPILIDEIKNYIKDNEEN